MLNSVKTSLTHIPYMPPNIISWVPMYQDSSYIIFHFQKYKHKLGWQVKKKKNSNTAASAKERELAWQKITDRVNV